MGLSVMIKRSVGKRLIMHEKFAHGLMLFAVNKSYGVNKNDASFGELHKNVLL